MIENTLYINITNRIKELMKANNVTGYKILKSCSIPSASFYKAINNEGEWKVEHLFELAKYFNVTIDYLITGENIDVEKRLNNLNEKVKKLERENEELYIKAKQFNKVAEAIAEYNASTKQMGMGKAK